jgi:hypothetical protein
MTKSNWWYEASFDARYKQVVEGRDLGMTVDQVARNVKVEPIVVQWFARDNKIAFRKERKKTEIVEEITDTSFTIAASEFNDVLDIDDTDFMEIVMETFGDIFTSTLESAMD